MHPRTLTLLRGIGISPRELRALDVPPIHNLPDKSSGFGLYGATGIGKTWALVQMVGKDLDAHVLRQSIPNEANRPQRYAKWLNWPNTAETLKTQIGQGYSGEIAEQVEAWITVSMLFLDDLGQERITGSNDYSLGVLCNVLDARYRHERRVFWTSNLNRQGLVSIYGARIVSRMLQAWPAYSLTGNDLRLKAFEERKVCG